MSRLIRAVSSRSALFHIEAGNITFGRVLFTYNAVKEDEISVQKGEPVHILGTNQQSMFLIHRPANENSPPAEGWVPIYIVGARDGDGSLRNSWQAFRGRTSNMLGGQGYDGWDQRSHTLPLMKEGRANKVALLGPNRGPDIEMNQSPDYMYEMTPSVHVPLTSVTVQAGSMMTLTCRICGRPRPQVSWKFQDSVPIIPDLRTQMTYGEDGVATLQISQVTVADSGEYSCIGNSELGTVVTKATATVLDRPGPPTKPQIKTQVGTSVHLEWSPPPTIHCGQIQGYTVEYNELGVDYWQAAIPYVPNTSQVIGDLSPGSAYQFRVSANNSVGISDPSLPSDFVTIPTENELSEKEDGNFVMWKTTFENDFTEQEEIERGRFSVVKKCTQTCSGREVATKFIKKRLITKEMVETEFNTLQSLQHTNLVQVFDLYETEQNLVIVMELMSVGRLLDYICGHGSQFDEVQVAEYIRQLLEAIQYLHNCRIAHLDIKPENMLVEIGASMTNVKLVDFGDARHIYNNYYIHALNGNAEFLAPEIVGGTPVGLLSDIWSVGVIMYVLLSGVSPFLDESDEETCSNILRNDYCFPDEFFAGISSEAKEMIRSLLVDDLGKRPTSQATLENPWIVKSIAPRTSQLRPKPISTARLAHFIERRKHQILASS